MTLANAFNVAAVNAPGSSASRVQTVAGAAGSPGFADGAGAQARFRNLSGVAVGADDSVYVADAGNNRIRVVRPQAGAGGATTYSVSTLAGTGAAGYADGPAAAAQFNAPQGVAVDAAGVVYVADTDNHRIRRVAADGTVTTLAGDGTPGFANGSGAQARFNAPRGVAADNFGNVYVADSGNSSVRRVTQAGEVSTVAGDGTIGSGDGPGARFDNLSGVACDGEHVYVYLGDTGNHRVRRLDAAGTVVTVAGASRGFADGSAGQARFAEPSGLAVEASGKIVLADAANSLVRSIDAELAAGGSPLAVTTLAGTGDRGSADGAGNVARFNTPRGVAVSPSSAVYVADTGNGTIRRVLLPPAITALSPQAARPGEQVTVLGERFDGRAAARNVVNFKRAAAAGGGQTAAFVISATRSSVTDEVPPDAATGPVTLQTEGGTATSPTDFTLASAPAPVISDFSPKHGPVGTSVNITGANLRADNVDPAVSFLGSNGVRLPALVTYSAAGEAHAVVPNGAVTGNIELTNAGGRATSPLPFTVDALQDFRLTVAPSSASAVRGSTATYVVSVSSDQETFTQLARLSAAGLPAGATAKFDTTQITSGATATLSVTTASALAAGSYQFTIKAVAEADGRDLARTVTATLNVLAGGITTLAGRVLSTEDAPIMGATVSLDGRTATTDAAGSFILSGVTAGSARPLMVDGRTASAPNRTYPVILEPAVVVAGQANVIPYSYYLPPIDTQYEVQVVPNQTTVAGNPRVPGLQMIIPPGANLHNRDLTPVTRVSITPLPIDRTPTPLPPGIKTAVVYTSQPGGALTDIPIPVVYPNLLGTSPGTRVDLYAFNHDTVLWYVYGTGTVSADGRTISPDISPSTGRQFGLKDFSWHFPGAAGPSGNPGKKDDCPKNRGGNPVDFSTGVKIEEASDLSFGGARGGVNISRTYTSDLSRQSFGGMFGRGWKGNFDVQLAGNFVAGGAGRLVTPEQQSGDLFSYAGTDAGGALLFTSNGSVGQLGDVLRKLSDGSFEYRHKGGGAMLFSAAGRLTGLRDANGNATTLEYTGANLTRVTDAVGRSVTLQYDFANRVTSVTDHTNRVWRYTYGAGALTTVTDPAGGVVRYEYQSVPFQLTAVYDKRGTAVKRITYDNNGRVTRQQFADNGAETYDYFLSGGLVTQTTVTDPLGRKRVMRFNASGYVVATVDGLGQTSKVTRDIATNQALSTSGPCGCAESARQYDARGNITTATNRAGQTIKMEYEPAFGRLTKLTDRLGRELSFTYDARGNLLTSADADRQTTRYEYDQYGQLVAVTDPLGHTSRYEYDQHGNMSAFVDALTHRRTTEYDPLGRVTAQVDALGVRSEVRYDALGRVSSTTDAAGAVTRYAYDANGNLLTATDHLGRKWKGVYDSRNRIVRSTDPLGRVTTKQYDLANMVTAETSPSGRVSRFVYDDRNQLASMTDPLGGTATFEKDYRGNLVRLTDPRGHVTTFTYDGLNRSTGTRDPLGRETRQSYDAVDNVSEVIDRQGRRTAYTYDNVNRPARVTFSDATVSYTYDAASRVTRIDDSQGGSASWTFDDAGRKLSETTPAGTVAYAYNDAGQLVSMTAQGRAPVAYGYDAAGRLSTITQGAEVFGYLYDALSRVAGLQRPNGVTTSYTYDAAGRVERLAHGPAGGPAVEDFSFGYNVDDEIETITSLASSPLLPAGKAAAQADAANRVPQFGQAAYAFDDDGQTTTKTDAQGTTRYDWDARGRLTRVTLPGGAAVSYGYDAVGRLASRSAGGATVTSLYSGGDVVVDRAGGGAATDYLRGAGTDVLLRQASAAGALYPLPDQLGSPAALTDAAGNVVERRRYEPYGDSAGSQLTRHDFTGRERDSQTGLLYYRARWYDPAQGRFISEDPAGFAGGLNKYAYVSGNPVSKTDPLGLYELNVHYYLTYYLVSNHPCFSGGDAKQVAEGDQGTDEDPKTMPGPGWKESSWDPTGVLDQSTPDYDQQLKNMDYHALHPGAQAGAGSPRLWQGAMQGGGNLQGLGVYLHYLQDTFSHEGFNNPSHGHLYGTHRPDKPWSDVGKAMQMAQATWDALNEFARQRECPCEGGAMPDGMKPVIKQFAEAPTSGAGWVDARYSIDEAPSYTWGFLMQKIRILGVPPRSDSSIFR
ncbi:MAG TPA: RHS repeat-associated core domain-containing protein [Pyrinomonadaceae bacterium]